MQNLKNRVKEAVDEIDFAEYVADSFGEAFDPSREWLEDFIEGIDDSKLLEVAIGALRNSFSGHDSCCECGEFAESKLSEEQRAEILEAARDGFERFKIEAAEREAEYEAAREAEEDLENA
ncbi:hypothetical protein [Parvibaculum sp.]|uniref:hypothetical protein n=1 Tax=Parvibaculum sp. TaxID=2024848 RepID=UPI00320DA47E